MNHNTMQTEHCAKFSEYASPASWLRGTLYSWLPQLHGEPLQASVAPGLGSTWAAENEPQD
jgi:hypothetical protein